MARWSAFKLRPCRVVYTRSPKRAQPNNAKKNPFWFHSISGVRSCSSRFLLSVVFLILQLSIYVPVFVACSNRCFVYSDILSLFPFSQRTMSDFVRYIHTQAKPKPNLTVYDKCQKCEGIVRGCKWRRFMKLFIIENKMVFHNICFIFM